MNNVIQRPHDEPLKQSKTLRLKKGDVHFEVTVSEGVDLKQKLSGKKFVEAVSGETLGDVSSDWLINNATGLNPKYTHPFTEVKASSEMFKELNDIKDDDPVIEAMRKHIRATVIRGDISKTSNWTVARESSVSGRNYYFSVKVYHELTDKRLDWTPEQFWKNHPHTITDVTRKSLAFVTKKQIPTKDDTSIEREFRTVEDFIAWIDGMETDLKSSTPTVQITLFRTPKYANEVEKMKTEFEAKLQTLKNYIKTDFNQALRLMYRASTSLPDEEDIIHLDGSRFGHTETEYQERR
jgi:hypothetical protein